MEPVLLRGTHSRWVHDCCWLAEGRLAVSCGFEGVAIVRPVPTPTALAASAEGESAGLVIRLKHGARVRACCSLGVSRLATASSANVHSWDAESSASATDTALRSISLEHLIGEVQALSGPTGPSVDVQAPILAAGTAPKQQARSCRSSVANAVAGSVAMLDLRTSDSSIGTLVGHTNTVWDVRHSAICPYQVCSASADGTAKVWDLRTRRVLHSVRGSHRSGIRCCLFAGGTEPQRSCQPTLLTGGFDKTIRAHKLTDNDVSNTESDECSTFTGNDVETSCIAQLGGYCFGLDYTDGWLVAGAGNPDYSVKLWQICESLGDPQKIGCMQTLLGEKQTARSTPCSLMRPAPHTQV